jgi:hypothetical protein
MDTLSKDVIVRKYLSFLHRAEKHDISWKKAAVFVGGEKRLERLIAEGRIRYHKPDGASNTMWRFNFADIVNNARPVSELTRFPIDDPRMRPALASFGVGCTTFEL